MYDRVVFPTDGSEGADVATEHALALAQRFEAPLHALYVADTSVASATDAYDSSVALEGLRSAGEAQLQTIRERAEAVDVPVTTAVHEGSPAEMIAEATSEGDVLVLGTHGRTGLDRYLIGSTTEKVIRTADVPVLAVPIPDGDANSS